MLAQKVTSSTSREVSRSSLPAQVILSLKSPRMFLSVINLVREPLFPWCVPQGPVCSLRDILMGGAGFSRRDICVSAICFTGTLGRFIVRLIFSDSTLCCRFIARLRRNELDYFGRYYWSIGVYCILRWARREMYQSDSA